MIKGLWHWSLWEVSCIQACPEITKGTREMTQTTEFIFEGLIQFILLDLPYHGTVNGRWRSSKDLKILCSLLHQVSMKTLSASETVFRYWDDITSHGDWHCKPQRLHLDYIDPASPHNWMLSLSSWHLCHLCDFCHDSWCLRCPVPSHALCSGKPIKLHSNPIPFTFIVLLSYNWPKSKAATCPRRCSWNYTGNAENRLAHCGAHWCNVLFFWRQNLIWQACHLWSNVLFYCYSYGWNKGPMTRQRPNRECDRVTDETKYTSNVSKWIMGPFPL